jgi:hypothetical protein
MREPPSLSTAESRQIKDAVVVDRDEIYHNHPPTRAVNCGALRRDVAPKPAQRAKADYARGEL